MLRYSFRSMEVEMVQDTDEASAFKPLPLLGCNDPSEMLTLFWSITLCSTFSDAAVLIRRLSCTYMEASYDVVCYGRLSQEIVHYE
jgi:hypothetical protein